MRKFFRRHLPDPASLEQHRWLRLFGPRLRDPRVWHLHRRGVAGGVAAGLLCGLVPGPFQMVSAALLALLFRVNLPLALLTTLYTNPLTIVPLYVAAYELGVWVSGAPSHPQLSLPDWQQGAVAGWDWLLSMGAPLLWGVPLLAATLAVIGYTLVLLAWRCHLVWRWRRRHDLRTGTRRGA